MKNLKIRSKLIVLTILTGLLPILAISILLFNSASDELEKSVLKSNEVFSTLTKDQLSSYFHERKGDGKVISNSDSIIKPLEIVNNNLSNEEQKEIAFQELNEFLSLTQNEFDYTDIFITDNQGKVIFAVKMKDSLEGVDLSSRDYVQGALRGNQSWSQPFYSDVIDTNVMALSTPIYSSNNNNLLGSVNLLFDQEKLNSIVHQGVEELGNSGDSYLINETGLLLTETRLGEYKENAALNKTISTLAVEKLSSEIKAQNDNFTYTGSYDDYLGHPVYGSLGVLEFGDSFVGLIIELDEAEAFAGVNALKTSVLTIVGIIIVLALIFLYFISQSITKPLFAISNNAEALSNYDLTKDVDSKYINRKDEIGQLAGAFQNITKALREIVIEVNDSSENLAASSEEMTATVENSSANMEEISASTEEISAGLEEVSAAAEEIAASSEEMNASTSELVNNMVDGNKTAKSTEENATKVEVDVLASQKKAESIYLDLDARMKEGIEKAKIVNEISNMANQIAAIADQTNLLALNAAIEAARAGEQGKGFAVVAEEVRKLASDSTETVESIKKLTEQVQGNIESLIADSNELLDFMSKDVSNDYDKFIQTAQQYKKDAENFNQITGNASHMGEELMNVVEEVTRSINEVTATINQSAEGSSQIAKGTEETSKAMTEMNEASSKLSKMSEDLSLMIGRFKI